MNPATLPTLPKPKARSEFPGDNVYMRMPVPPQAYVPYSPADFKSWERHRPSFAARDTGMVPMSIVGLALTVALGLPVGIFTGPPSLRRAKSVEALVQAGRRPRSDLSDVTTTRVSAWIGIVMSVPLLLVWLLILFGALLLVAG